ncbi:asparagine synthase (glutamine-hydrolyzing) [Patescibacteria group bacterium]
MCGIVGSNFIEEKQLIDLSCLMEYRGPDQDGSYQDNNVSFAHKRLAILDLSEDGKQPFTDATKNYIIVYNGEIYNFIELKEKLLKRGYKFRTKTDTEVLLNAYIEWGENCPEYLNGDFAFCVYDKIKKILFVARDRLGFKPFYFYHKDGNFLFGSELKLFLKAGIKKEINKQALNHYLFLGFVPGNQSIINNINKLPPGSYGIFDIERKTFSITKYWDNHFSEQDIPFPEATNTIRHLLDDSVKKRMIADVPVGAFLSGGIDSSIICYLMKKYNKNLKTYSISFDYKDYDEAEWAKKIAQELETNHYEIRFDAQKIKQLIPNLVDYFNEPLGDPSMIPTYLVASVAKKQVKVCLSGTGGDEIFFGYNRYSDFIYLNKLRRLPAWLKKSLSVIYKLLNKDKANKLNILLNVKNEQELYLKLFSYLFRDKDELKIGADKSLKDFDKLFRYDNSIFNILNFDQNEYLPNDLLVKEDRATMGVSLEGRIPFLDHRLVEYVNNLPLKYKFRSGQKKYILKKAFHGLIPAKVLRRKKKGFGVPLEHYIRKELKDYFYDKLFNFELFNYYDKEQLKKLWKKHQKGDSDYSHLFWVLFSFNRWYEKWMV